MEFRRQSWEAEGGEKQVERGKQNERHNGETEWKREREKTESGEITGRDRNGDPKRKTNRHRWVSTSTLMSAKSNINICYSDIGRKYVGLKTVILISEGFRYRHLILFRYPKNFHIICRIRTLDTIFQRGAPCFSATVLNSTLMDAGYRISNKSLFRSPI